MKITLSLLCVLTGLSVSAQDTTHIFYPSGKLAALQVKIDSSHIWERSFFESGKLRGELTAISENGKHVPIALKEYFEDGKPMAVINDTVEIRYDTDGSIFVRSPLKNHHKNGVSQTYLSGKLWLEVTYKENRKDGWMIGYDTTGKINSKTLYRDDKQDGPSYFYKKDVLTKTIEYDNACPIKVTYFDKTGKQPIKAITIKKEIWLEEGKPIGCK